MGLIYGFKNDSDKINDYFKFKVELIGDVKNKGKVIWVAKGYRAWEIGNTQRWNMSDAPDLWELVPSLNMEDIYKL